MIDVERKQIYPLTSGQSIAVLRIPVSAQVSTFISWLPAPCHVPVALGLGHLPRLLFGSLFQTGRRLAFGHRLWHCQQMSWLQLKIVISHRISLWTPEISWSVPWLWSFEVKKVRVHIPNGGEDTSRYQYVAVWVTAGLDCDAPVTTRLFWIELWCWKPAHDYLF